MSTQAVNEAMTRVEMRIGAVSPCVVPFGHQWTGRLDAKSPAACAPIRPLASLRA